MILGVSALAYACSRQDSQPEKSSPGASSVAEPATPLQASLPVAELQLLRARVAGLEAELHPLQPAALPAAAMPLATGESSPHAESSRAAEPAALQARYDAAFAAESVDPPWARAEESAVQTFFDAESAKGAHLEKAECRESMCRMRLRFDDSSTRSHFLTNLGSPPFDHGGFYRIDEDTGAFMLYTSRKGRTLPSAAPEPT
jgi:hypothetical protein